MTDSVKDCYARARDHPSDLVAGARPHQGFHRDAAAERLPVAAHVGHQRARRAVRSADPHRRPCTGWRRKASRRTGSTRKGASAIIATNAIFSGCASSSNISRRSAIPQEFIQNLKVDLYPEEVYTFTPKGLVKAFPRGATPIDFAYSIHTDVGHRCVGARVNGKMVPLRTHLRSGDIVEIITAAGHKPSRDWLSFVVTSHARYEIKYLIRSEERVRAIELGRKVLDKEARRYDINLKTLFDDPAMAKLLAELSLQKIEDVYALVGLRQARAEAGPAQARPWGIAPGKTAGRPRHGGRHGARSDPARRRSRSAAWTT